MTVQCVRSTYDHDIDASWIRHLHMTANQKGYIHMNYEEAKQFALYCQNP